MKSRWEMKKYPMFYGGVRQTYPNVAPGQPIFSKAVKVGSFIFIGPKAGRTITSTWGKMEISDSVGKQVEVTLDKLRSALDEAGSSMNNIVKTIMYVKSFEDVPFINKAETDYYRKYAPRLIDEPPVRNVIQVVSMAHSVFKEEIGAIAVESENKPGWEMKKYPTSSGGKGTYPGSNPGTRMSKSAVVGNLVFISDMDGLILETGKISQSNTVDQTAAALDKIRFALQECGSSMDNIIKSTFYIKNVDDIVPALEAGKKYYQKYAPILIKEPPICGVMHPVALSTPESLVEIEVTAVLDRNHPEWQMKKYQTQKNGENPFCVQAVTVGDLIFCAGANPLIPETGKVPSPLLEEQMAVCLDKIRLALEQAGGSMNNMCRIVTHVKDMKDYARMRKTELEYYQRYAPRLVEEPPGSSPIQPVSLARPDYYIEVGEAMGVVS